jgi:hypothetical protein
MSNEPTTTEALDDSQHQRRQRVEWAVERCGMALIFLILVIALAGLLGPGPASFRRVTSSDGNLTLEHYSIQRYAAPAHSTVRFRFLRPGAKSIRLGVSRTFTDSVTVESITPEPEVTEMEDGRLVYVFRTPDLRDEGVVTLRYKNDEMGSIRCAVDLAGDSKIQVSHFVLP